MKIFLPTLLFATILSQPSQISPRDLLRTSRPLTTAEIAVVLGASQRALAGKTFRLAPFRGGQGPDVLMGRNGAPRRVRWSFSIIAGTVGGTVSGSHESQPLAGTIWREEFTIVTDYTGRSAHECNAAIGNGELVVEYRSDASGRLWTATPRLRDNRDFGGIGISTIFEMLQGVGPIASGERKQIDGRTVRAFVSAWTSPAHSAAEPPVLVGDPIPNAQGEPVQPVPHDAVQTLWIDTRTLLPVRWEVFEGGRTGFVFNFNYTSIDLRLPKAVKPRDCAL